MPHAVFNLGTQSSTADLAARLLIPGIEPGGSRAGRAMKPALLIRNAWIEPIDLGTGNGEDLDYNSMTYFLKLSQELGMDPGLLLPIAHTGYELREGSGVGRYSFNRTFLDIFKAHGTVWVPRVVGIRVVETGVVSQDVDVHLEYERIELPWMEWFLEWEFLDGVINNEREY